jgi:nucleotide-binding universal stress UspA family protein
MTGCVVVPLDGSPLASRALAYASVLAHAAHTEVLLLRVLNPRPHGGEPLVQVPDAQAELERIADRLQKAGVGVRVEVSTTLFGSPAEVIAETAKRENAELIILSTHGRSGLGRWLYGSVAEQVVHLAPVPVLLVPTFSRHGWPTRRVPRFLLALDGSEMAATAVEPTRRWAQALHANVALVRARAPSQSKPDELENEREVRSFESAADRLRGAGIDITVRTPAGKPAECIADLAHELDVDVIVMGTHRRLGVSRLVLGSVATETLHRAALPMLLVKVPTADRAPKSDHAPEMTRTRAGSVTLLVPMDLTENAEAVLPEVGRIASIADAEVILLNVFMPIVELGRVQTDSREEGLAFLTAERRMFLERKAEQLHGLRVSTRVEALEHGEAVDEGIARVAEETEATLVIMTTRRLASTTGVLLGSVAQGVLARSPCPVTIVRRDSTSSRAHHVRPSRMVWCPRRRWFFAGASCQNPEQRAHCQHFQQP